MEEKKTKQKKTKQKNYQKQKQKQKEEEDIISIWTKKKKQERRKSAHTSTMTDGMVAVHEARAEHPQQRHCPPQLEAYTRISTSIKTRIECAYLYCLPMATAVAISPWSINIARVTLQAPLSMYTFALINFNKKIKLTKARENRRWRHVPEVLSW